MADTAASPKKTAKAKKPAKVATHPPVAQMVTAAISELKDRKGSSLIAIKKYIDANYKVDIAKLAPFIKKFLRNAVAKGALVQAKGTGATGSFKLVPKVKGEAKKKPAKKITKKAKSPVKAKKPTAKKAKSPAKAKKPAAKKSPAKAKKPVAKKSPAKAKKPVAKKSPAKAKKPAAKKSPAKAKKPAAKKPAV